MGLVVGEVIAPMGGVEILPLIAWDSGAQRGVFTVSVVEDFDVVEEVDAHLVFVVQDLIAHRGGFVATEERFHRGPAGAGS